MLPGEIPAAMRDGSVPSVDDWQAWKPIPSVVAEADLAAFESELGIQLPAHFRAFLRHVHFLELNTDSVRFCEHPPNWREAKMKQQLMDLFGEDGVTLRHPLAMGLFVIGDDPNDGGRRIGQSSRFRTRPPFAQKPRFGQGDELRGRE